MNIVGLDTTNKWPTETSRKWGKPINMTDEVKALVDDLLVEIGSFGVNDK